ncbi:hypothetical protein PFISCL1PPCAC_20303, partial [Pristionchus fissidentatus]
RYKMDESCDLTQKIQQLEAQLETNRNEVDRYKSELESAASTFRTVIAMKNSQMHNLERELKSTDSRFRMEMEQKDNKICLLEKQAYSDKAEYDRCKRESELKSLSIAAKDDRITELGRMLGNVQLQGREVLSTAPEIPKTTITVGFAHIGVLEHHGHTYTSRFTPIGGINWFVQIRKSGAHLGVYLSADNPTTCMHSCLVFCRFHLISHRSNRPLHSMGGENSVRFNAKNYSFGIDNFIPMEELLNRLNGYIKDDSIMVAVDIKAFPVSKQ